MSRKRRRKPGPGASVATSNSGTRMEAFSFGEPVPVLDRREILDYVESWYNGRWYEPPINPHGLSKSFRASPHHSSAIYVKRNILASTFIPHRMLSRAAFSRWALEYLIFGNGYLERRDNLARQPLHLQPALAKYVRRGQDERYFFVQGWQEEHEFPEGSIFHLAEPDINQEIYGVPEYLSALQAAYLNESATLFRRKYYLNGSHAGFILYVSDPAQQKEDIDNMREALKQSKGPGNFRNLFLYSPDGKKDGIQVIPISEVAAKDEFLHIKDASRDDVLAAHRVPPQLMGIIPKNKAGLATWRRRRGCLTRTNSSPCRPASPSSTNGSAKRLSSSSLPDRQRYRASRSARLSRPRRSHSSSSPAAPRGLFCPSATDRPRPATGLRRPGARSQPHASPADLMC